ncbi:hypothetical protein SAMN04487953_12214 [Billgrantia desiderata]|nr:hypothetical protein SAMN04487953_12214 [Halomonas desiderata]
MDDARSLRSSGCVTCQVVSSRGHPGTPTPQLSQKGIICPNLTGGSVATGNGSSGPMPLPLRPCLGYPWKCNCCRWQPGRPPVPTRHPEPTGSPPKPPKPSVSRRRRAIGEGTTLKPLASGQPTPPWEAFVFPSGERCFSWFRLSKPEGEAPWRIRCMKTRYFTSSGKALTVPSASMVTNLLPALLDWASPVPSSRW